MNFDGKNPVIVATLALVIGVALIAAGRPATISRRAASGVVSNPSTHEAPGVVGAALPLALGGFRGLVADIAWLRVQTAWEREDEAGVLRWSEFASTADPEALPFWINSARMLAYDFADLRWRDTQANGGTMDALRRRIDEEQAHKALHRLQEGTRWLPGESRLWIEMGNVHLNRRNDPTAAERCFARALSLPGAPAYAGRIHAGLLWRTGRQAEAVSALRNHLENLRVADPARVDPILIAAVESRLATWEAISEAVLGK